MSTYSAQAPTLSTEERASLQAALGDAIMLTPHERAQRWAARILEVGALFAVDRFVMSVNPYDRVPTSTFSAFEIIAAALREPTLREVVANCLQLIELEQRPIATLELTEPIR